MLHVAICDDNKPMLDFLGRKLSEIFAEAEMSCEISTFLSCCDFLESNTRHPFDIVFLDIVMPDIDGFEAAKQIRAFSRDTYIIFITTESSMVYDSFDFQPFYFIPKSKLKVTAQKLRDVVGKLSLHISTNRKIVIEGAYESKKVVSPSDILYIKSNLNNVEYYFLDGTNYKVRGKLSTVMSGLNVNIFVRTHNRYIVNMAHIDVVDYPNMELILISGAVVAISRGYKKKFDDMYLRYRKLFS